MSDRVVGLSKSLFFCLFALVSVLFPAAKLLAQDDSTPKYDIFVGYQWIHPGADVPNPFSPAANPSTSPIPDMAKGFGASFTYNFDRYLGWRAISADVPHLD
jgi:hypothetical protein